MQAALSGLPGQITNLTTKSVSWKIIKTSSPGARVLGEAEFCTAAKLPKEHPWPQGFTSSHVRGGCEPSGPKRPCSLNTDRSWINGN